MTNGENGKLLGQEVMRALAVVYGWPGFQPQGKTIARVDTALFARLEGRYRYVDEPDYSVQISADGGHLFLQESHGGLRFQLHPESETDFFCLDRSEEITFMKNLQGNVDTLLIGEYEQLERVE